MYSHAAIQFSIFFFLKDPHVKKNINAQLYYCVGEQKIFPEEKSYQTSHGGLELIWTI